MRPVALLLTFLMLLAPMAGCISSEELPAPMIEDEVMDGVWVTGGDGLPVDVEPFDTTYYVNDVGQQGPEPSIGVTSSGCIFFIALEKVMRSCDSGETWVNTVEGDVTQAPSTSDPWGWVDPDTDRIFNVQMVGLATTWIGWSDDDGETWLGNPHDSGPVPLNDHIKLATGPWTDSGYGAIGSPVYDSAVYFCYNKLAGIFCYTSLDGGATFAVGGQAFGLVTTNGGLHGAISSAPDGTVYVPPRVATPTLVISKDNGLNWEEKTMGEDVERRIHARTPKWPPTPKATATTCGPAPIKASTCPAAPIPAIRGSKPACASPRSRWSQACSRKSSPATLAGWRWPTSAARMPAPLAWRTSMETRGTATLTTPRPT